MKKLWIILVLLCYGLSSSGATLHLHFCCGKLDGVSLEAAPANSCGMDHDDSAGPCCADRQLQLAVKDEHKAAAETALKAAAAPALPAVSLALAYALPPVIYTELYTDNSPPYKVLPLYILHCVYRI